MELTKVTQNNFTDTSSKDTASVNSKQKTSDKFEKLVAKAADKLQAQDNKQPQVQDNTQVQDDVQVQDKTQTQDKLQVNEGTVDTAASDAKAENCSFETIKDIKDAIDALIKEDTKGELSEEALSLLNMLSLLLGSLKEPAESAKPNAEGTKLNLENFISGLQQKLNLSDAKSEKLVTILDKLVNTKVFDSAIKGTEKNTVNEVKKELFALINILETSQNKNKTTDAPAVKSDIISLKEILPEIKQVLASKGNEQGQEHKDAFSGKKEEELLKSIASDGKQETSDTKIANFMNKFSVMKNDNVVAVKEPEAINQKNLTGDIIKTLKYMETNSVKNLTVKINPKELGEVVINITMEAGIMKAAITASNKDAYNLIQGNLQDINSRLNVNEVKVSNLSLNIYNEDTTYYSNESGRENYNQGNEKGSNGVSKVALEEESLEEDYSVEGNVNRLA